MLRPWSKDEKNRRASRAYHRTKTIYRHEGMTPDKILVKARELFCMKYCNCSSCPTVRNEVAKELMQSYADECSIESIIPTPYHPSACRRRTRARANGTTRGCQTSFRRLGVTLTESLGSVIFLSGLGTLT